MTQPPSNADSDVVSAPAASHLRRRSVDVLPQKTNSTQADIHADASTSSRSAKARRRRDSRLSRQAKAVSRFAIDMLDVIEEIR